MCRRTVKLKTNELPHVVVKRLPRTIRVLDTVKQVQWVWEGPVVLVLDLYTLGQDHAAVNLELRISYIEMICTPWKLTRIDALAQSSVG